MRDVVRALSVKEFTLERDCRCPICMDVVAAAPGAWQVPKCRGTRQDSSEPSASLQLLARMLRDRRYPRQESTYHLQQQLMLRCAPMPVGASAL